MNTLKRLFPCSRISLFHRRPKNTPPLSPLSARMGSQMADNQGAERTVGKRLVIGCDGTWDNSDAGADKSLSGQITLQIPSNITRLIRCLAPVSSTGALQVAYYQRGIGSDGDLENSLIGGLTGDDLTEKIREAYGFACNNYSPWEQKDIDDETKVRDEIILLGFSRGAFTARAISSLISDVGLLTKDGMESFYGIVEDWKNQDVPGKEWQWYQTKFGKVDKTFGWDQYRETLAKANLTRTGVTIRAVGVFDTVGSLGIPRPWTDKVQGFSFVNTEVAQGIQYAFQALALDEHRALFSPTVWEWPSEPNNLKELKQCWFAGVHCNCGGGYADAGISNITLAWMISQMEKNKILEFSPDYENFVQELNQEYYEKVPPPRPWGLGRVYNSIEGLFGLIENMPEPPRARTPGNYHEIDDKTGKPTSTPLKNTGECIHRSVRVRIAEGGLGMESDPPASTLSKIGGGLEKLVGLKKATQTYATQVFQDNLAPLKGFELVSPTDGGSGDVAATGYSGFVWKNGDKTLPEDELLPTERQFLLKTRTFT